MCGIFAHIFFLTPKSRREIAEILINGLKAQEYRGYDSAGKYKSFIFRRFLLLYVVPQSLHLSGDIVKSYFIPEGFVPNDKNHR